MRTRNTYTFILAVVAFLCMAALAYATTEADLKAELEKLQKGMQSAVESYEEQEQKLSVIQAEAGAVVEQINATEAELAEARARLAQLSVDRYRGSDNSQLLNILLSARSFKDFIVVFEYSSRVGEHYADSIQATRELSEQLSSQHNELAALQAEQEKVTDSYRRELTKMQDQLVAKEAEFESLREKLAAERKAANVAAGIPADMDVTVSVGSNGFVFPVVGSYSYIDSFYAPRASGTHHATDIMAPYGTPVVAFTGGYWSRCDNALGGIAGYVNGSNGWKAYYGHLQSAIPSGPVSAGQVVGAVGDTGNATGIPHLHLEMWDGSGRLVNPYPLLRAME